MRSPEAVTRPSSAFSDFASSSRAAPERAALSASSSDDAPASAGEDPDSSDASAPADEDPEATSKVITNDPSLTLSPTLTSTDFTVPACGLGTSMVALSVSRVIRPSSFSMLSPSFTNTSMTSTSPSSPMSGTLTSMVLVSPPVLVSASLSESVSESPSVSVEDSPVVEPRATSSSDDASAPADEDPESSDPESSAALSIAIRSPSEILSPTLTLISSTVPPNGAGMSIEALSLSTVIKPSSASTLSPLLTRISMTSTSSPPTSGASTSFKSAIVVCAPVVYA